MFQSKSNPPPSIKKWTIDDVGRWLRENDFDDYIDLFATHKIDGDILLHLTESDLREPPMKLIILGDIKRIGLALTRLRRENVVATVAAGNNLDDDDLVLASTTTTPTANHQNGHVVSNGGRQQQYHRRNHHHGDSNGSMATDLRIPKIFRTASAPDIIRRSSNSVFLISRIESPDTEFKSLLKTILAIIYCCGSLLLTSFVMVIVHDRTPDMKMYPPLPDIFLDNVPLISWAFEVCELLACVLVAILTVVVIFHKHRLILLRRMFSITGTVFSLRCITMMITSLSVPGIHLECTGRSYGDIYDKIRQAFRIWYGMGMSLRGVRTCGDYMFSGHTTTVTLLNHFITEYTPDDWHNLHTASWVMNLFSIFFILAGHEHYSIDVFVAFYISSRLFLYYHSMAYHASSVTSTDARTRGWFPLFWFFESGGKLGRVPNEYGIPFGDDIRRWWNNRAVKRTNSNTDEDSAATTTFSSTSEEIEDMGGASSGQHPTKVKFQMGSTDLIKNGQHKKEINNNRKNGGSNGIVNEQKSKKKVKSS